MKKIIVMCDTDTNNTVAVCDATSMCNATDYVKCVKACAEHADWTISNEDALEIAERLKITGGVYDDCYMFTIVDLEDVLKV